MHLPVSSLPQDQHLSRRLFNPDFPPQLLRTCSIAACISPHYERNTQASRTYTGPTPIQQVEGTETVKRKRKKGKGKVIGGRKRHFSCFFPPYQLRLNSVAGAGLEAGSSIPVPYPFHTPSIRTPYTVLRKRADKEGEERGGMDAH